MALATLRPLLSKSNLLTQRGLDQLRHKRHQRGPHDEWAESNSGSGVISAHPLRHRRTTPVSSVTLTRIGIARMSRVVDLVPVASCPQVSPWWNRSNAGEVVPV
jgi:hypothetical protein